MMDDLIGGLIEGLASSFGGDLFQKIARKKYFPPAFFLFLMIVTQIIIAIFIILLSIPGIFNGYYSDKPISIFLLDGVNAILFDSQPYALLFSSFVALLGTLSYLWHRKYSCHQVDPKQWCFLP